MQNLMAQTGLAELFRTGVRIVMEEQAVSQHELARRTGMSYPGLNRVLTGKQTVTLPRAEKIAEALGTTFEEITEKSKICS